MKDRTLILAWPNKCFIWMYVTCHVERMSRLLTAFSFSNGPIPKLFFFFNRQVCCFVTYMPKISSAHLSWINRQVESNLTAIVTIEWTTDLPELPSNSPCTKLYDSPRTRRPTGLIVQWTTCARAIQMVPWSKAGHLFCAWTHGTTDNRLRRVFMDHLMAKR